MTRIRCFHPSCNASMATGASLFRVNAKGQPGIWSCRKHRNQTDASRDPELDELVDILEGRTPTPSRAERGEGHG